VTASPDDAAEISTLWPEGPPTHIENFPPEVAYEVRAGVANVTSERNGVTVPATLLSLVNPSLGARE
jgi:hypothetical protein